MVARILTALIGIPIAVVLVFWPGGLPFAVAVGVVSVIGAMEFYSGARKAGARPVEWAGLAAAAMFVVSARTYERGSIGVVFPAVLTSLLILSLLTELSPPGWEGRVVGFGLVFTSIGIALAPPLFGLLVDLSQNYALGWIAQAGVFGLGAWLLSNVVERGRNSLRVP